MSDTPRTDAVICRYTVTYGMIGKYVEADFARELERELAEARQKASDWEREAWKADEVIEQRDSELTEAREHLNEWSTLHSWGGTPEIINEFIKGQQTRIHAAQDAEEQRDRLVGIIGAATVLIAAKGRHNTMLAYQGLSDALAAVKGVAP